MMSSTSSHSATTDVASSVRFPRPSLVTLDVTGTLFTPRIPVGESYLLALREHLPEGSGWERHLEELDADALTTAFMKAYKAKSAEHPAFGAATNLSSVEWWRDVVRHTYIHGGVDPALLQHEDGGSSGYFDRVFADLYYDVFVGERGWALLPNTHEVLQALSSWRGSLGADERPVMGVISNFDERATEALARFGLLQYFDFVLLSREQGVEKPHPQIFQSAVEEARRVRQQWTKEGEPASPSSSSCVGVDRTTHVHIGDSFERDIVGATQAGWSGVLVNNKGRQPKSDTNSAVNNFVSVNSLEDIPALFGLPTPV